MVIPLISALKKLSLQKAESLRTIQVVEQVMSDITSKPAQHYQLCTGIYILLEKQAIIVYLVRYDMGVAVYILVSEILTGTPWVYITDMKRYILKLFHQNTIPTFQSVYCHTTNEIATCALSGNLTSSTTTLQ